MRLINGSLRGGGNGFRFEKEMKLNEMEGNRGKVR